MPDVGVLQLKIAANVSSATTSLKTLSDRLAAINKATTNFNLQNVSTQIEAIVNSVKGDKSVSTAVKNLGSLLNAISAFSKVKSFGLDEAQINNLQLLQDVANGFKMGQVGTQLNKMREALGGSWDVSQAAEASKAIETLSQSMDTAKSSGTADKIKEVSSSLKDMTGGTADSVGKATSEIVDYQKVVNELGDTLKNQQVTFKEPLMGLNLQQFGGGSTPKFENTSVQNWRDEMAGLRGMNNELKQTDMSAINNISDLQRALSELGKIKGADGLQRFADGINAITAAMKNSGDSNLTLGRLASAISRFKEATNGFSIPSFARLESLARTLQENFNAENGLKRIADGINAFKQATQGMDLSNARGISAILKSMNANASQSNGTVSAMKAISDSISTASSSNTSSGFTETSERIADVTTTAEDANRAIQQLDFSVFDPSNLPFGALGHDISESSRQWTQYGWIVRDSFNTIRNAGALDTVTPVKEMGSAVTAIIPYNENLENTWERICEREREAVGVQEDAFEATQSIEKPVQRIVDDTDEIRNGFESVTSEVDNTKSHVDELGDAAIAFARQWNDSEPKAKYNGEESESIAYINNLIETASKADLVAMRMDALRDKMYALASSENANGDQLARMVAQYRKLEEEFISLTTPVEEVKKSFSEIIAQFSEMMFGSEGLQGSFKRMFPTIASLSNRFSSLIKYRVLRTIIKQISEGFQEGTENYYYYSQVIGGSFATNMDSAASSLAQMKNSIGAAAAPLINSLIPYLQTAVNWFIQLINYVNQFVALLNGQSTWSKATAVSTKAFDDISSSASGASDSISDLLADWDELNIIQNESSGGGSGTGTATAGDYASMFEEVSEYEEGIKEVVEWIQEHMESILGIAAAIGVAILAWKVSNAFSGLIGDLASLVLGGALIAVGLQVTYESAYQAGYNGGFDAATFIATAGGVLSTTIGAALIGFKLGGTWGAVIGGATGFIASVATAIYAYDAGEQQRIEESKWGSIHYTAEQIEEYAKSQFTFDVDAEIEVMSSFVTNSIEARSKVTNAIESFKDSLRKLDVFDVDTAINVDTEEGQRKIQALKDAAEDAQETITAIQELIDKNEEGVEFTLTNFKFVDSEGNDISSELLSSIKLADQTLKDYFTGIGTQISKWIYEGEQSGWANGEYEMALELMQSQERILDNAEALKNQKLYEMTTDSNVNQAKNAFAVQDYDTAKGIVEAEQTRYEDYYNAAVASVEEEKQNLIYFASLAESAAKEIEDQLENETDAGKRTEMQASITKLRDAATSYTKLADEYIDGFDSKVQDKLTSSVEKQKQSWLSMLTEVYGQDYSRMLLDMTNQTGSGVDFIDNLLNLPTTERRVNQLLAENNGSIEAVAQGLYNDLVMTLQSVDTTGATQFYLDTLGGNLYDLIKNNTDLVQNIADGIIANTENRQMAYDIFKAMFGLDDETASKYIQTYAQNVWGNAAKEIEEQIPNESQTGNWSFTFTEEGFKNQFVDNGSLEEAKDTIAKFFEENPVQMKVEPLVEDEVDIEAVMGSSANNLNWWTAARSSFESVWDSVMANISSTLGLNGTENGGFGGITITNERDDEQDTRNIEEGTRRGTAGMETKQGQTNSYLSLIHSDLATIAARLGSGLTGTGVSTVGGLVSNAINAFNLVKG